MIWISDSECLKSFFHISEGFWVAASRGLPNRMWIFSYTQAVSHFDPKTAFQISITDEFSKIRKENSNSQRFVGKFQLYDSLSRNSAYWWAKAVGHRFEQYSDITTLHHRFDTQFGLNNFIQLKKIKEARPGFTNVCLTTLMLNNLAGFCPYIPVPNIVIQRIMANTGQFAILCRYSLIKRSYFTRMKNNQIWIRFWM